MVFARRLSSGKITAFLRVYRRITGDYTIETRLFNKDKWESNINMPLFNERKDTENWLKSNYEEVTQ